MQKLIKQLLQADSEPERVAETQATAELALPGRQWRPLGGDAPQARRGGVSQNPKLASRSSTCAWSLTTSVRPSGATTGPSSSSTLS